MANQKVTKPQSATGSRVDTISFTRAEAEAWLLPDSQRELNINQKVRDVSESIKRDSGVIPGILTFGEMGGNRYLIDGQHRRAAFLLTDLPIGYADVRIVSFTTAAEMGAEFVQLNTSLVKMKPDDVLRGMEHGSAQLQRIRKEVPWVGYDSVRRNSSKSTMVSMSVLLRCWFASAKETPQCTASAATMAATMSETDATHLIDFCKIAMDAWGRDESYRRLWGALNLTLCMWLFRRLVAEFSASKKSRVFRLTQSEFRACMASLSANEHYCDWLIGRLFTDRHRSPGYARVCASFRRAFSALHGGSKNVYFPVPAWASNAASVSAYLKP